MAVTFAGAELCLTARAAGVSGKRCLMIGRQNLRLDPAEQKKLENRFGIDLAGVSQTGSTGTDPYAEAFLHRIGWEQVDSMDCSSYEGATIVHDLNLPLPDSQKGQYDIVYDGGSLEHIFNVPQALRNYLALLKPGGHLLAEVPSNNWMGHGFYQFSPELFHRVFRPENGCQLVLMVLILEGKGYRRFRVCDPVSVGQRIECNRTGRASILLMARKESPHCPLEPNHIQQSDYQQQWDAAADSKPSAAARMPAAQRSILFKIGKKIVSTLPDAMADGMRSLAIQWKRRRSKDVGLEEISWFAEAVADQPHPTA